MAPSIKHIYIAHSCLFINGELVLKAENPIFVKFLKEIYNFAEVKYPKYFKMDGLSKLGFLAAEVLLQNIAISGTAEKQGIVLENRASTWLIDMQHQETINDRGNYFPSPANFVYTLPNVMTGEICIRLGFKGENAVFVNSGFDPIFVVNYIKSLFAANKADFMLGGFVDADDEYYDAFMFYADRENQELLSGEEMATIYQQLKQKAQEINY